MLPSLLPTETSLLYLTALSLPHLYRQKSLNNNCGNSTMVNSPCDNEATPVCSLLFTCRPISTLYLPISTCCVYTPLDLGPSFEMDRRSWSVLLILVFMGIVGRNITLRNGIMGWHLNIRLTLIMIVQAFVPIARGVMEFVGMLELTIILFVSVPVGWTVRRIATLRRLGAMAQRLLPQGEGMN